MRSTSAIFLSEFIVLIASGERAYRSRLPLRKEGQVLGWRRLTDLARQQLLEWAALCQDRSTKTSAALSPSYQGNPCRRGACSRQKTTRTGVHKNHQAPAKW